MTRTIFATRSAALAALVGLFILVNIAPSQAADLLFTIKNYRAVTMTELYVSRRDANSWGQNVLDSDGLPRFNGTTTLKFDSATPTNGDCRKWRLKAVFADGEELSRDGMDICRLLGTIFDESEIPRR